MSTHTKRFNTIQGIAAGALGGALMWAGAVTFVFTMLKAVS